MRLIDGDHLEERVRKIIKDYAQAAKDTNTPARVIFSSCGVIGLVKSESTVNAVPVVHGKWITCDNDWLKTMCKCSKCGAMIDFQEKFKNFFCYHCGARMDGK